ncbi:hypothetical protein V8J88_08665 [Massilia sp. W12]|uniref:hypothetical protein n=1 Tax=Massilia sp. W12 TaxID=3126507 RepID=UPI0030D5D7B8
MLIVVIAWAYVVMMMALTEESFIAGLMDVLFYLLAPLALVLYLQRSKMRRQRAEHLARQAQSAPPSPQDAATAAPPAQTEEKN